MKRLRQLFVIVVTTLFIFGCGGGTQSEKMGSAESQLEPLVQLQSPGHVANVSKIDHQDYMDGSHKNFTCSDCHDKGKNVGMARNRDDDRDDDHGDGGGYERIDNGDSRSGYDGGGEDRGDSDIKERKKHRGHKGGKGGKGRKNRNDSDRDDGDEGDGDADRDDDSDGDHDDDGDDGDSDDGDDSGGSDDFVHVEDFEICAKCHSGFSAKHNDNNFSNRCNACHKSGDGNWINDLRYKYDHTGLTNCVSCHFHKGNENVNDHNGDNCESCHAYDNWEDTPVALHDYTDNCKGCHIDNKPASHPANAPAQLCENCHSREKGWLAGVHEATTGCVDCHSQMANDMGQQCETCHEYGDWLNVIEGTHDVTSGCKGCHAEIVPPTHPANIDMCETCHSQPKGWLAGVHEATTDCVDCHEAPNASFHNTAPACETCHTYGAWMTVSVPHTANLVCKNCHTDGTNHYGTVVECQTCHDVNSLPFQHKATTFPLNHKNTDPNVCQSCHVANDFASSGSCIPCHAPLGVSTHKTNENAQCLSCHPNGRK